jgi:peptide-methionine (R)-S-oxide reductase
MKRINPMILVATLGVVALVVGAEERRGQSDASAIAVAVTEADRAAMTRLERSDADWRARLSPEAFHILREKGTEPPFTSELLKVKGPGVFRCAGCGLPLFSTEAKFESGTGWPSFSKPFLEEHVVTAKDDSHGMTRDEVVCARCGGHLGHVFNDGPQPTGLRYCINGLAIAYEERNGR